MFDKIKVSLPKATLQLLQNDCDDFKIVKTDGKPNMNAFINQLLNNYYQEFCAIEERLHDDIRQALDVTPERYKEEAFKNVVKLFSKQTDYADDKKDNAIFSFKPTKVSEKATAYIERALLSSESLSSYYRRLFCSYAKKTKNEREKIIFKENYEILQKAIRKNVKVCVILKSGKTVYDNATIYAISSSKEELFNYVLLYCGKNNKNNTVRLASIHIVSLLTDKADIPIANKELFDRQIACAPQYPMYSTDDELIKVQLTPKGQKLFEKIYLYRPTPVSIEGDIYTFNCSGNQLLYYFERFGESALILSPKRLGLFMRNYYYFAYKKYKTVYRKD